MKDTTKKSVEYSQIIKRMDEQLKELELLRKKKVSELAFNLWGQPPIETDVMIDCNLNGIGTVISWVCGVDFDDVPIIKYKCKTSKGKQFFTNSKISKII
jgi:hypothetical protein